jgi:hypothetical protein
MRQKRNPNLEEDRTNILNNMRMDQRAGEYTEQRGTSIKEYFEALKNNSGKININDLEIFVKTLEKNESI